MGRLPLRGRLALERIDCETAQRESSKSLRGVGRQGGRRMLMTADGMEVKQDIELEILLEPKGA